MADEEGPDLSREGIARYRRETRKARLLWAVGIAAVGGIVTYLILSAIARS